MAAMDFKVGDSTIGKCLDYKRRPEAKKIISKANDGTVYAQSVGKPIIKYEVDIYCSTNLLRVMLETASANCSEVTLYDRNNSQIVGFIQDETIEWKEWRDGHGIGHFTIIKE